MKRHSKTNQKRKKVLLFIEDGSFTFDNRVIREVNALESDNWDVTVISPKYSDDPFFKKLNERVRAYYYPKPTTKSPLGHIFEHVISLLLGSVLTLWVNIRYRITVFHGCNPMDILWIIALPYKLLGKKFIFDQHDLCPELYISRGEGDEQSLFYKILLWLERYSYKFADVVIATNESYKEMAVQRGSKDPKEVFVVRNGPDLKKFRKMPPNIGLKASDEVLVGYLGNMNPQDGVIHLVDAARDVLFEHGRKDIKFIFIGGGSSQKGLMGKANELGLQDNVTFTGRIPDNEMLAALSACDICVQPDPMNALNDKSTMNKVLEYMALEKPVISFDLKETRISCGEAALYVEPNNVKQLSDRIVYLADHVEIRQKMAKIGRERIEKKLSWSHSIPNLIAAYEQLIEN